MAATGFCCPACNAQTFEIGETEDLSAFDGATCGKCGHVVTQRELLGWVRQIAVQKAKERLAAGE